MDDDPTDSSSDEFAVRLSWPKVVVPPPEEPEAEAKDAPKDAPKPAVTPRFKPAIPAARAPSHLPKPAAGAAPATLRAPASAPRPAAPTSPEPGQESGVARTFVDAFDRLSDRLLDRLRVLRQDVDADLNGLRSEVAMLRQAVEDNTYGLQIRQLQTSLDEVRAEVAGLRRAVLEWPELERVADEVSAVRGDLSFLFDATSDGESPGPSAVVTELREVVGRLTEGIAASAASESGQAAFLVDEVSSIRTQLGELARRMPAGLDDERQLDRLADAVAERLFEQLDAGGGRRSKRR
jgi:hypothetical protein